MFCVAALPAFDSVSIEWRLAGKYGIARYHPDGEFGSRWTWAAVIEPIDRTVLIMAGYGEARFRPRMLTLLRAELRKQGFTTDAYERRNRGVRLVHCTSKESQNV